MSTVFNPPKFKPETRWHASEKEIQNAIIELLLLRRLPFSVTDAARFRYKNGAMHYSKVTVGWPDLIICLPPDGKFLGLEVKDHKGKVSPEQQAMHDLIRRAGGRVEVVRSVDDVLAVLEENNP